MGQDSLNLKKKILLTQHPEYWDHRHVLPCLLLECFSFTRVLVCLLINRAPGPQGLQTQCGAKDDLQLLILQFPPKLELEATPFQGCHSEGSPVLYAGDTIKTGTEET